MGAQSGSTTVQDDAQATAEATEELTSNAFDPADTQDPTEPAHPPRNEGETNQGCDDVEHPGRRVRWSRVLTYGALPGLALLLVIVAGFLKWQDSSVRGSAIARIESVAAAKESTIALLSYQPDSVEQDLEAAQDRLTGPFQESYTQLTHDVVIPGAKQKRISTVATVPAASSVSATPDQAVVLLFVNQTAVVGSEPPSDTASSVRVTLDKVGDRWLISAFDPV